MKLVQALALAALAAPLLLVPRGPSRAADAAAGGVPPEDLRLFEQVMRQVERSYVRPVAPDQLTANALKGMVNGLDPHSDYMDRKEYKQTAANISGAFGGIGIRITEETGVPKVISPIDGTPAAHAGLEPGDLIVAVNGEATDGMDLLQTVSALRGDPGSRVTLTIERGNKAPFPVTLRRATIDVPTVKYQLEPNRIAFLRISEFDATTPGAARAAIETMKREAGGHLRGLMLDLRDDPGGLLGAAIAIAGDFLDGGTVVSTRGRLSADNQVYAASGGGDLLPGVPVAVLVNSGSASASEIVAGALQDRRRATVMGTRSFGKGSVQTVIPLGDEGALRLTTALYYTPSGRSIQGIGISPDVVLPAPAKEQVTSAVINHENDLHGAFSPVGTAAHKPMPQSFSRPIKPDLIATPQDGQLKAALAQFERELGTRRAEQ